ncbi:hypothetical protein LDENG_00265500 [Lucifuga dentata]|nr:hypothetical protein LDENG_00265500 [Lucifuga dentata]
MERLRSANMTKANVEHAIISQLSRTRDVLKKAKTNLQENEHRISSLHHASSPLLPPPLFPPPPPLPRPPGLVKV